MTAATAIKTALIIDDHPAIHVGCRQMLEPAFASIHGANTAQEALDMLTGLQPDLILLDLGLPDGWGLDMVGDILALSPGARILVFSMNDKPAFAARALQLGVHGFLSKGALPAEFRKAIAAVMAGEIWLDDQMARRLALLNSVHVARPTEALTPRERHMLRVLAEGGDLRSVAETLEISYKTAANLSTQLKRKLAVGSFAELIRAGVQQRDREA